MIADLNTGKTEPYDPIITAPKLTNITSDTFLNICVNQRNLGDPVTAAMRLINQ